MAEHSPGLSERGPVRNARMGSTPREVERYEEATRLFRAWKRAYTEYQVAYAHMEEEYARYGAAWDAERPGLAEELTRLTFEKVELQEHRARLMNQEASAGPPGRHLVRAVALESVRQQIAGKQAERDRAGSPAYRRALAAFERAEAKVRRLDEEVQRCEDAYEGLIASLRDTDESDRP